MIIKIKEKGCGHFVFWGHWIQRDGSRSQHIKPHSRPSQRGYSNTVLGTGES